jgi:hypothetical protein
VISLAFISIGDCCCFYRRKNIISIRLTFQKIKPLRIVLNTYCRIGIDPVSTLAGVIEKSRTIGLGLYKHVYYGLLVLGDLQIVFLSFLSIKELVFLGGLNSSIQYTSIHTVFCQAGGITLYIGVRLD